MNFWGEAAGSPEAIWIYCQHLKSKQQVPWLIVAYQRKDTLLVEEGYFLDKYEKCAALFLGPVCKNLSELKLCHMPGLTLSSSVPHTAVRELLVTLLLGLAEKQRVRVGGGKTPPRRNDSRYWRGREANKANAISKEGNNGGHGV